MNGQPAEPRSALDHRYDYHNPANQSIVLADRRIRSAMRQSANLIEILVPQGREHALAMTKLEEAMLWATAGIARAGEVPVRDGQDGTLVVHDGNYHTASG